MLYLKFHYCSHIIIAHNNFFFFAWANDLSVAFYDYYIIIWPTHLQAGASYKESKYTESQKFAWDTKCSSYYHQWHTITKQSEGILYGIRYVIISSFLKLYSYFNAMFIDLNQIQICDPCIVFCIFLFFFFFLEIGVVGLVQLLLSWAAGWQEMVIIFILLQLSWVMLVLLVTLKIGVSQV